MQIFLKLLNIAAIVSALGVTGAQAQSLAQLASRSKFIANHLSFLEGKKARSVVASTNPVCPSVYWYSSTTYSADEAKRRWTSDVKRQMQTAGFPQNVIAQCAATGSFVFENLNLRKHRKNDSYSHYVKPAVMLWEKPNSYGPNEAPVFLETWDYTGSKTFRVYDHKFSEICKLKSENGNFSGTCKSFGKVSGKWSGGDNRDVVRFENKSGKVAIFTGRTVNYARSNF